jgi:hypothetical protein
MLVMLTNKTILVTANKNSLNIVLEQAIFKMDEVGIYRF